MGKIIILIILLITAPAYSATREVGSGQTYSTISSAISAASTSDIINVHAGTYSETVAINKSVTLQANEGDLPQITGQIFIYNSNTTVDGFYITGWTGTSHGINVSMGVNNFTIKNCVLNGDGILAESGSGIYARNNSVGLIENNEIYGCTKGININSSHSTDGTYANGTTIRNCYIHDNPIDGIDIQGEYITITGCRIYNNIDTNWAATHPDGIQFIKSDIDGYSNVHHVRVSNCIIKNHTQNIFVEGFGADDPSSDVDIWNNVIFTEPTTINGVDMTSLNSVHVLAWGSDYVRIYNNYFGYAKGEGLVRAAPGSPAITTSNIIVKNNIFDSGNTAANYYAVATESTNYFAPSDLDNNIYNMSSGYLFKDGATGYTSIAAMKSSGFETNGLSGNPNVGPLPNPTITTDSIAHNAGTALDILYSTDILGTNRPQESVWDIGPYEFTPPPSFYNFLSHGGLAIERP